MVKPTTEIAQIHQRHDETEDAFGQAQQEWLLGFDRFIKAQEAAIETAQAFRIVLVAQIDAANELTASHDRLQAAMAARREATAEIAALGPQPARWGRSGENAKYARRFVDR